MMKAKEPVDYGQCAYAAAKELLFTPVSITTLIDTEDARFVLNGISPIAKGDLKWRDALLVTGTVNSNAKEGIRGLTRVAATEWGKDGVNVNIVCPLAWTAQLENFQKAYPDAFKANVKMPPAGHYGDVEKEIGRVCVQLASPDFKYMNGETLTLEGGMGLRP